MSSKILQIYTLGGRFGDWKPLIKAFKKEVFGGGPPKISSQGIWKTT